MIVRWMLAAMAFSALVAVAAYAAEQLLRLTRSARRLPWVLAIVVSVSWPFLASMFVRPQPLPAASGAVIEGLNVTLTPVAAPSSFEWLAALERLGPGLLTLWAIASLVLLLQLARAMLLLRRVQREARRTDVDGTPVLVHDALGPAAIGVITPRVIVPSWLLELDPALRSLVLAHEQEHCRAGDSRLVWLAVLATALMPWNLALWWSASRLRLAMEIDCDARTIGDADPAPYARLLLLIAQRHGTARYVPTLSPTAAQLQRRIQAMQTTVIRFRAWRASAALAVGVVAIAAACSPRVSSNLTSPSPLRVVVNEALEPVPPGPAITLADGDHFVRLVSGHVNEPRYPDAARSAKAGGVVTTQFIVNADGRVDAPSLKVLRVTASTADTTFNAAFAQAVRTALPEFRYQPATVRGKAVRQLVKSSFEFTAR